MSWQMPGVVYQTWRLRHPALWCFSSGHLWRVLGSRKDLEDSLCRSSRPSRPSFWTWWTICWSTTSPGWWRYQARCEGPCLGWLQIKPFGHDYSEVFRWGPLVMLSMWWTKTSLPARRCTDCHFSVARSGVPMPSRRWWSLCCLVWSLERTRSWLR